MTKFVALLRGINVGGNNLIRMPALKAAFEEAGYDEVSTYIQSGNVLFATNARSTPALERKLEQVLLESFSLPVTVLARSQREIAAIVDGAPDGFGADPDGYRYDVWFLKQPLDSAAALAEVEARLAIAPEVDHVVAGTGVLYARRVAALASRSRLTKVVGTPLYRQVSIRNWNTTTKLKTLLES